MLAKTLHTLIGSHIVYIVYNSYCDIYIGKVTKYAQNITIL